MQTFVPFPDVVKSVQSLDWQRLGKQRVETLQILHALDPARAGKGWKNHPAVKMWEGCEGALARYGLACSAEWTSRGYRDILCSPQLAEYADRFPDEELPLWWGDERVHLSHQSNLIRKLPSYYTDSFPGVPDNLPYAWPRMVCGDYVIEEEK